MSQPIVVTGTTYVVAKYVRLKGYSCRDNISYVIILNTISCFKGLIKLINYSLTNLTRVYLSSQPTKYNSVLRKCINYNTNRVVTLFNSYSTSIAFSYSLENICGFDVPCCVVDVSKGCIGFELLFCRGLAIQSKKVSDKLRICRSTPDSSKACVNVTKDTITVACHDTFNFFELPLRKSTDILEGLISKLREPCYYTLCGVNQEA